MRHAFSIAKHAPPVQRSGSREPLAPPLGNVPLGAPFRCSRRRQVVRFALSRQLLPAAGQRPFLSGPTARMYRLDSAALDELIGTTAIDVSRELGFTGRSAWAENPPVPGSPLSRGFSPADTSRRRGAIRGSVLSGSGLI
jgi:hypothetical protein